jgi:hypothetical protein
MKDVLARMGLDPALLALDSERLDEHHDEPPPRMREPNEPATELCTPTLLRSSLYAAALWAERAPSSSDPPLSLRYAASSARSFSRKADA